MKKRVREGRGGKEGRRGGVGILKRERRMQPYKCGEESTELASAAG